MQTLINSNQIAGLMIDRIKTVSESNGAFTIPLDLNHSIYKIVPTADYTFNISIANIAVPPDTAITFYLYVDMSNSSNAYEATWDSSIQWGNTSPVMSALAKYLLAFTTFDGGTTWVANQMYSWL